MCGHFLTPENQELVNMIEKYNLSNNFTLIGPQAIMAPIFNLMNIYISSSKTEGTSNSILEAMSRGLPCIATDVGDARYVIDNSSLVAKAQSPEAIAQKCLDLIRSGKKEREFIGKILRQRIKDHFSIQHTVVKFETVYKELIKRL
jgi:glycosyltransferase involved in cell wall biosynthesis